MYKLPLQLEQPKKETTSTILRKLEELKLAELLKVKVSNHITGKNPFFSAGKNKNG